MDFDRSLEFAQQQDAADPLNSFRERFFIPKHEEEDAIYFCGHSLGLQPRTTAAHLQQELDDWRRLGVKGHLEAQNPWLYYHHRLAEPSAQLVGAHPEEVVVMNGLTVNAHLLMVSFYRPTSTRYKILVERDVFPSDAYAIESQVRFHGFDPEDAIVEVAPREGTYALRTEDILQSVADHRSSLAMVFMGGVNYYTGQYFDLKSIAHKAHEVGATVGFNLAHAAGNVRLQLHDWDVDFACWCSYKYLNSGPGSPAGAYIHERFANDPAVPRFAGWWGYDEATRFEMQKGFVPMRGAQAWQLSNAPVLGMAAHSASLDIFREAGITALVEKSQKLTGYLEFLIRDVARVKGFAIITPEDPEQRGCQLSILVDANGRALFDKLTASGVVADWREPNLPDGQAGVIRVAPVPLYNTFEEVYRFYEIINA